MKVRVLIVEDEKLIRWSLRQKLEAHQYSVNGVENGERAVPLRDRPWLSVHWRCCHVYSRVYRNAEGTAYKGACPSCGQRVRATVGPGGLSSRFFTAS